MKKLMGIVFALMLAPMAWAADYQEGVHYEVVSSAPVNGTPTVTEYFSFYCPHCYSFAQTYVGPIKQGLADGVKFQQAHADFINGNGPGSGMRMSRALAIAKVLKVEESIELPLFAAIQDSGRQFTTDASIKQFFVDAGVNADDYDKAAKSFPVNAMVKKWQKDLSATGVRGVPALIVNNKYKVEMGSIKSLNDLHGLLNYLAAKQ
ncbi:thiol:disulfide interchange protein DsbA/DsbL [Ferrimonas lipolytica]|uniref:Thiol:disulfide interchange protein n=1 Tax=Ferrimonas lipolytica TaxID=2724191 RepID=A0A6H1UGZ0_9GAMM|nr:thiol:disulfide interchange protein DsbA/DsbL [Ferrimonas lipolytica]QIZ78088.1 thiol:disulfide interchange protein DsbA/DsbL [Ferrimonas lipolytica]